MAQGRYLTPAEQAETKRKREERLAREKAQREARAKANRGGLTRSQGSSGGPTYAPTKGGPNRSGKPVAKPSAKGPKNGDTTIKEGHKFVFSNGRWIKVSPSKTAPKVKDYTDASGNTYDGNSGKLKSSATSSAPKSSGSRTSTPAARPAGTQPSKPASNAGMKNQDKDFRGNPNNSRSISATLKDLKEMRANSEARQGKGAQSGGTKYGAKANTSKVDTKAESGYTPKASTSKDYSKASTTNNTSTAYNGKSLLQAVKDREEEKKRKKRLGSTKPGSTY